MAIDLEDKIATYGPALAIIVATPVFLAKQALTSTYEFLKSTILLI